MNAKAWAWKTVELFMMTRKEAWKQRPDLPGLSTLGACLSSACLCDAQHVTHRACFQVTYLADSLLQPTFTSEDLKTTVRFWLLGTWDEPSRIETK